MTTKELRELQNLMGSLASYLGHSEALFGMELAGVSWTDGSDYCYYPKNKRIYDFSVQECLDTISHIHEWLKSSNQNTKIYE